MADNWRRERKYELEGLAGKKAAGLARNSGLSADRDARRLRELVPPDTRDLTARMFGDPLPGRRAIDMRAGR